MPDLTIPSVTVHGEWIVAYLAIGLVLWLPLEAKMWSRTTKRRTPFWRELRRSVRKRPHVPVVAIVAWPLALYEAFA